MTKSQKIHIFSLYKGKQGSFCRPMHSMISMESLGVGADLDDPRICKFCKNSYENWCSIKYRPPYRLGILGLEVITPKPVKEPKGADPFQELLRMLRHKGQLTKSSPKYPHPRNSHLEKLNATVPGDYFVQHHDCYLREARAILQGKDVSGRNRCVKLIGD